MTHNTQYSSDDGNCSPAKDQYEAEVNQVDRQVTPYWSKYHGYLGSNTSGGEPSDHASSLDGHIPRPEDHKMGK
jgi:hypothetical protein